MVVVPVYGSVSVSLEMGAIKRKKDLEDTEEAKEARSNGRKEARENPYQYRTPSEYDLPDLR